MTPIETLRELEAKATHSPGSPGAMAHMELEGQMGHLAPELLALWEAVDNHARYRLDDKTLDALDALNAKAREVVNGR